MEKIVNYVRNGRGVGLLFVLAAAVLISILFAWVGKDFYAEARGQALMVAQDFLPITVEKGVITEPADTYKRVNLDFGRDGNPNDMFSVVLNTRDGVSVSSNDATGLYLLKNQVYVVSSSQMRYFALQDGVWTMERFETLMDDIAGAALGVISVLVICVLFLVGLLKTFVAAVLGLFILRVARRSSQWSLAVLMRLCAVLVAVWEVLRWGLVFLGVPLSGFSAFVIVLVLEMLFLFKENYVEG